jgi:phospholipid/cholesterol/gamma-HCH transport system substrate-binding protein
MVKTLNLEFLVGLLLLCGVGALGYVSLQLGQVNLGGSEGYALHAEFPTVGGLLRGAVVQLAGVEIGRVEAVNLTEDYRARVTLRIYPAVTLPGDTRAAIKSTGLIGERYVEIAPGTAAGRLAPGGTIRHTEAPVDIQDVITKFIFGDVENTGTGAAAPSPHATDPASMLE